MKRIILLVNLFLFTTSLFAFDGEREGIVIGGGVGYGPVARNSIDGFSSTKVSSSGTAFNLLAGYGYNNNTLFLVMHDGIISKTHTTVSAEESVYQGFTGLGVCFYFDEVGSSFLLTSGIGVQHFSKLESTDSKHELGLGYLIGCGYEFREHFQLYASLSNGQTKTTFEWEHTQLMITLTIIGY